MIEGQTVSGLHLLSRVRPLEIDQAGQKRGYVLDLSSPLVNPTTIYDVSGKGNHGTITGPTWTRLPSGLWVLDFDGDDYVNCGNAASLQITNNLSVRVWFKTPATFTTGGGALNTVEAIIGKYVFATANRGWHLSLNNVLLGEPVDNLYIALGDPADGTFEYDGYYATNLAVSTWYLLTMTFASGALLLRINGVNAALTTVTGAVPATLFNAVANVLLGALGAGAANLGKGQQILQTIKSGTVLTAAEDLEYYQQTRHLFGVSL